MTEGYVVSLVFWNKNFCNLTCDPSDLPGQSSPILTTAAASFHRSHQLAGGIPEQAVFFTGREGAPLSRRRSLKSCDNTRPVDETLFYCLLNLGEVQV